MRNNSDFFDEEQYSTNSAAVYKNFGNAEELDEENWHVGILCARVLSIILLVIVVILFAVGAFYSEDYYIIAGVFAGFMILVFILSFFDLNICKCLKATYIFRYDSRHKATFSESPQTTFNPVYNNSFKD